MTNLISQLEFEAALFSILLLPAGATALAIQLAALHLKRQNCFSVQRKKSVPRIFDPRKHAYFDGCSEFEAKLDCTCSPCIWKADSLPRPGMVSVSG